MVKPRTDFEHWMAERVATTNADEHYDREAIEEDMAVKIGGAVRELRERAGLNQTQLAAVMNASQPTVARIESGKVMPTFPTLMRIVRVLDAHLVVDIGPHGIDLKLEQAGRRRERRAG